MKRRNFVASALRCALWVPASIAAGRAVRAQANLPRLDEKDPAATALGYRHDAAAVDRTVNPTFKAGQDCANCLQVQGKDGEAWRGCNLFPGRTVSAAGWCKVWVLKPSR